MPSYNIIIAGSDLQEDNGPLAFRLHSNLVSYLLICFSLDPVLWALYTHKTDYVIDYLSIYGNISKLSDLWRNSLRKASSLFLTEKADILYYLHIFLYCMIMAYIFFFMKCMSQFWVSSFWFYMTNESAVMIYLCNVSIGQLS